MNLLPRHVRPIRSVFLCFALFAFFAGNHSASADPGTTLALNSQIDSYIKGLRGRGVIRGHERTAWLVYDLTSQTKLASINEDLSLQAASMVKPYLALAFFHQVEAGRLIYGPESRKHMELMIQKSNNSSTNWVMRHTGGPAATENLLKRHYPALCRQLRLVEYIPSNGRTYRNRGSAGDYGRFLATLWKRQLPRSEEILRIMGLPGTNRLYTRARRVPKGTRVFNKTGSTAMCCGDMGILVAQRGNGGTYPYIVVGIIDSARRSPSYGTWISQRADVIREVSNLAYLAMKQRHSL
ncbi:MAG: serine hydrolase [Verrucomicrobiales bacterium]